jgi:hypothetical protein
MPQGEMVLLCCYGRKIKYISLVVSQKKNHLYGTLTKYIMIVVTSLDYTFTHELLLLNMKPLTAIHFISQITKHKLQDENN